MLEITVPTFPSEPAYSGAKFNYRAWCESEVERIGKIPGHSPRIAWHRNRAGEATGKIMVVDDEYTLPSHNSHSDGVMIQRFKETRSHWVDDESTS